MQKFSRLIVKGRKVILLLFLILAVYCVWGMTQVNVEYSITKYLPADTDTRLALDIMEEEFTTYGTTTLLVRNVSFATADQLHMRISEIEGVKSFSFYDTDEYYRESTALFSVTFTGDGNDAESLAANERMMHILEDYDILVVSSIGDNYADELQSDVNFVLVLAVAIIIGVLLITSESFAEVPVFLLTFAMAALLNMGTNHWFGSISFISNSVCVILQLALAIDYAIILCTRFAEEKKTAENAESAMISALGKVFPEICSSSLTTVAGLLALATMSLRLGADLGFVLAKSILCSMCSVFFFMPCVTLAFSKAIDKTAHKSFIPSVAAIGKCNIRLRYVLLALFVLVGGAGVAFSLQTDYVYSTSSIDTARPSASMLASEEKARLFGESNMLVVLVPAGDFATERQVIDVVQAHEEVQSAVGLSAVEIEKNGVKCSLTEGLTYRDVSRLLGAEDALGEGVFAAYAYFSAESSGDGLQNSAVFFADKENYKVSFLELCDCAMRYDDFISAYLADDAKVLSAYETLRDTVLDAKAQLQGENYTRTIFDLRGGAETKETFALLAEMMREVKAYCHGAIFAGDSVSAYDLDASFSTDNLKVSLLTAAFVFLILLFTFRSLGLPLLLTLTIQCAIFVNFAYYAITGTNVFFFVYLIVSAIQMGATIDYAIVLTHRFEQLKLQTDKRSAVIGAVDGVFPTIATSGTILAVASFLIGSVVGDPLIGTMGMCLGRGVLISIAAVLFVLPALLYIFDTPISKTRFRERKSPTMVQNLRAKIRKGKNKEKNDADENAEN